MIQRQVKIWQRGQWVTYFLDSEKVRNYQQFLKHDELDVVWDEVSWTDPKPQKYEVELAWWGKETSYLVVKNLHLDEKECLWEVGFKFFKEGDYYPMFRGLNTKLVLFYLRSFYSALKDLKNPNHISAFHTTFTTFYALPRG